MQALRLPSDIGLGISPLTYLFSRLPAGRGAGTFNPSFLGPRLVEAPTLQHLEAHVFNRHFEEAGTNGWQTLQVHQYITNKIAMKISIYIN